MSNSSRLLFLALLLLPVAAAVACSDGTAASNVDDEEAVDAGKRKDSGSKNTPDPDPSDEDEEKDAGKTPDAGPPPPPPVYAHSATTLYRFDVATKALTEVGALGCVRPDPDAGSGTLGNDVLIDLAVNKTGQVYATTFWRFVKVDPASGACTVIREASQPSEYPNSLAFVPDGNGGEVLLGYAFDGNGDALIPIHIDTTTGQSTAVVNGALKPKSPADGKSYVVSGDIVSIGGSTGKTYVTVKQVAGSGISGNDLLAEISLTNGTITKIVGDTGQKQFFGVASQGDKLYGFGFGGGIFEIDTTTGAATLVLAAKDTSNAAIPWYGAGVATAP